MLKVLSSRYVYVYKDKFRGSIWGATNMTKLAEKSGIKRDRIRYLFDKLDREDGLNRSTIEFDAFRIDRLPVSLIFNKNDK